MKNLTKALILAMLGLAFGWGLVAGIADEKPGKTDRTEGQKHNAKKFSHERNGGLGSIRNNPKFQEELKRHKEVMKGLFEQAKELRQKIREAMKAKREELKAQKDAEPQDNVKNHGKTNPTDNKNRREFFREEMKKIVESFRPQAEMIAGQISGEIILHRQNILNIINAEQSAIKEKIINRILMQGKPEHGNFKKGHEDGKRSGNPEHQVNPESPK